MVKMRIFLLGSSDIVWQLRKKTVARYKRLASFTNNVVKKTNIYLRDGDKCLIKDSTSL